MMQMMSYNIINPLFFVWLASMLLDILYTFKNRDLVEKHETNPILHALYKHLGGLGFAIMASIELAYVLIAYNILLYISDGLIAGSVFIIISSIHIYGFVRSRRLNLKKS
jgi:hypothetical protein